MDRVGSITLGLSAAAGALLALTTPASATPPLVTAFGGPADQQDVARMVSAGAGAALINVNWAGVAPQQPLVPESPADPAYHFATVDQQVRDATVAGLQVILDFAHAPAWAEGPDRPSYVEAGTWKPDPAAVGDFAEALAARYSGSFSPSLIAPPLPRVRYFEVWNEPNVLIYLTPQWQGRSPASPKLYRQMLNSAYAGIKSAQPNAVVVTAGTAP
jgi:aryl-phospho-beta-D-glucosidase BglC (GH1 family)